MFSQVLLEQLPFVFQSPVDLWFFVIASAVGPVILCVLNSCSSRGPLFSQVLLDFWSFVFASPFGLVILCVRESCWNRYPLCSQVLLNFAFVSPVGIVMLCVSKFCGNRDPFHSRVLLESLSFVFVDSLMEALRSRNMCGVTYHTPCCVICILLNAFFWGVNTLNSAKWCLVLRATSATRTVCC